MLTGRHRTQVKRTSTFLTCAHGPIDERTFLNSYPRARGAGYQHGDRNGCLKGMREGVLDEIERWTEDPERSPVFWLNGLAGREKQPPLKQSPRGSSPEDASEHPSFVHTISRTVAIPASYFLPSLFSWLTNTPSFDPTLCLSSGRTPMWYTSHFITRCRS